MAIEILPAPAQRNGRGTRPPPSTNTVEKRPIRLDPFG